MAKYNRDDEAKINPVYLGAGTKESLGPIIEEIKKEVGMKNFILQCLFFYEDNPRMFKEGD